MVWLLLIRLSLTTPLTFLILIGMFYIINTIDNSLEGAISFDGVGEYVDSDSNIGLTGNQPLTISFDLKLNNQELINIFLIWLM